MKASLTLTRIFALCLLAWLQLWSPLLHAHGFSGQLTLWHLSIGAVEPAHRDASPEDHAHDLTGDLHRGETVVTADTGILSATTLTFPEGPTGGSPTLGDCVHEYAPRAQFALQPSKPVSALTSAVRYRASLALPPAQGPPSNS